jgi:hypothetical protein
VTESQVRALFEQIADGEATASRVDTQLAIRRGRARLRWRRARLAAAPVLATATAAVVALAVTAGAGRPGAGPADGGGPAAPRQFNPLVASVTFGWLPAGQQLLSGGITPAESYMDAGSLAPGWALDVYARGQCHLTRPAGLQCPGSSAMRLSRRAPDVAGHRAFWSGPGIAWQYARGGWAWLSIPAPDLSAVLHNKDLAAKALKIAGHVRYDATTPLLFPAQFRGLPSQWRVHDTYYEADAGRLRAEQYTLTTSSSRFQPHVGDLGVWTDAPYVEVRPSPRTVTCTPHDPASQNTEETINGYRVVLKRMRIGGLPHQELCGAHADGLSFYIEEFGAQPTIGAASLFRQHMRLLGTNPANWTTKPLG